MWRLTRDIFPSLHVCRVQHAPASRRRDRARARASRPAIKGLTDTALLLPAEGHIVVEEVVLVHPDLATREEGNKGVSDSSFEPCAKKQAEIDERRVTWVRTWDTIAAERTAAECAPTQSSAWRA